MKNLRSHLLSLAALTAGTAGAADLFWDGGAVNIATNGNGASTYVSGTWNTSLTNWDAGAAPHVAWNNAASPPDNAIFGGTYVSTGGNRIITIGSNITVNQIQVLVGGLSSSSRYDIGASATQNDFAITFGGTYSDAFPAITGTGGSNGFINNNFPAKVTGTVNGGLVINHGSNITTPGSSGRFAFTNANSNFTGDVVMVGGNLSIGSQMGDSANKLVLKGGALFISGSAAITSTFARDIHVAAASGLSTNSATAGLQTMDLTGKLTGSSNLTRYSSVAGSSVSEVRFAGDMSGFTGSFENTGTSANSLVTIQTTVTSGGSWKISGGTLRFNTTDDTHIANGTGKSDLIMNGGTLDMNGKSETINGLSGVTGIVQNQLAASTSTLTLGDADTTASFGGTIRNSSGTGGTLGITKAGTGTQTLTGTCSHTGPTLVSAGQLLVTNSFGTYDPLIPDSSVTVDASATFGVKLQLSGASAATNSLITGVGSILRLDTGAFGNTPNEIINATTFTPVAGTVLQLRGFNFATGTIPLIKYTTLDGAGFGGLGRQLPYRVIGDLVDNSAESRVDLNITSAESAVWDGDVNGNWDVNPDADGSAGTFNWKTSVTSTDTRYAQGPVNTDQVTFDGSATGTSTVNLTTTLTPLNVLVNNPASKTYTFAGSGKLSGETALVKDNDGTLILANPTPYDHTGGTSVLLGTLQLGDGTTPGLGQLGGAIGISGTLAIFQPDAVTVTNPLSGFAGTLLKLGTNTLTLDATSTFSADTVISTGTIAANTATSLGSSKVTLGDAATGGEPVELTLNNRVDVPNAVLVSANGSGTATLSASNTGTGTTNPARFNGTITLDRATTFRSDIVGDSLSFAGKITGTITPPAISPAPVVLTISGGQTVSLDYPGTSNPSDFTGDIAVTGTGTSLQLKPATGSEVIPDSVNVDLAAGTFLKLAVPGSPVETIAKLTGTGTVERSITGTQTLAVGSGGVSSTFDGLIRNGTGSVALRKIGGGTFTLSNPNTYTGSTFVLAGNLQVNGSITSATTVSDDIDPLLPSGTLGGTGTVAAVTVQSTGKLSPATDTTIGTLTTTGNVTFATATEEYIAQINSDGTPAADRLAITGNLALNSAKLTLSDLGTTALTATTRLILATYSGTLTGTFKDGSGTTLAEGADVVVGSNTYKINYADPEGAGKAITLNKAATGGYSSWAGTNGVGGADEDDEKDAVYNGVEYVLGTDPKAASATGVTTTVTATEFKFTFTRSDASETPDTAVFIETSNNLATWNTDGSPHVVGAASSGSVTIVENPAAPGPDPGTDTVTLTVPRNSTTKFARLKVIVSAP